jgi:hypothetical protein
MQSVDDKVLLVKTTEPKTITDNIKKSAVFRQDGDTYEVAVRWGLKETKALMKLGIENPPSPIQRHYKWSGKHKPFDHQKTTASFLTLNDKAFCFNEQATGKTASFIWTAD